MSVSQSVLQALKDLDVPVRFQTYSGPENTYITFFHYLETGELYADDQAITDGVYTQVDVWSEGDYHELVETVAAKLKAAGFLRRSFHDEYEEQTGMYHKVMRWMKEVP